MPVQAADENIETETVPPSETSAEAPLSTPVDNASEGVTDGIIIDGDKLELHLDRKMRAIGNASITRDKQTIQGDVIDYDVQNDELHVTGNASINVGNASLTGPELSMRLSESIGEMHDASISLKKPATSQPISSSETFSQRLGNLQNQQIGGESLLSSGPFSSLNTESEESLIQDSSVQTSASRAPQSRGDAKAIFFEGQDKKRLIDARYTTCAAGVDDWYIKAKEIRLNDYTESGVARNAYIEFKGVPLIYTPWVSFSYNNQRKSGLLAPTVGSTSRSGFEVSTPFYWNISPNMDATMATRVLSKRGVQLQGEFRYLEENFSGIDSLEYLQNDNLNNENRYYANLKHQHNLGSGWSAGYSLEKVSDDQYFSELSTRIVTTSRINLPQQFNVNYADNTWQFNALAQKYQTLDGLSYPYERLPQLTLIGNKYYENVDTNLFTQLVAFDTNNDSPVKVTGTRFTLYPSISMPFNKPYGYVTPKFGVHHTNYSLNNIANNLQSQQRTLPIFSVDSGLYFDRDVKLGRTDYSQTIEPRMYYVYIPDKKQSDIPIFDTSESDLNFSSLFSENQFTGNDRINNANQLSLALTTRLIESSTGTQRLSAAVGQRYYFADQVVSLPGVDFRKNNSSDIIAGLSANLKTSWNVDAFWQYNTDDSNSVRTTL
ncbi:MAG: LPS assembly protein LptD, partial [Methylotenera sp.]